jgi:hypothetical protein
LCAPIQGTFLLFRREKAIATFWLLPHREVKYCLVHYLFIFIEISFLLFNKKKRKKKKKYNKIKNKGEGAILFSSCGRPDFDNKAKNKNKK